MVFSPPLARPYRSAGNFAVRRIRIRPEKRDILFRDHVLSTWLTNTLRCYRMVRFGDLDGRWVRDLRKLRRIGRVQLRELHGVLAAHDALLPVPIVVPVPPRFGVLSTLLPNPLRRALLANVPEYAAMRYERVAIRDEARAVPLDELPMPAPLFKLLRRSRYRVLGDLHGTTFADLAVNGEAGYHLRSALRQLHGLLALTNARAPSPPRFEVPARVRHLPVEDVATWKYLRTALRACRVRRLGDLATLTPARIGPRFGPATWEALLALHEKAQTLRVEPIPVARAIDAALARLPAKSRQVLLLRFGAVNPPLVLREVAVRCAVHRDEVEKVIDKSVASLRADLAVGAVVVLREMAAKTSKRRPMSSHEADVALKITRSRPRYTRDFYLRVIGRLDTPVWVDVSWRP